MSHTFLKNSLLADLPRVDLNALTKAASLVELSPGQILCEAGEEPGFVYFPLEGIASLLFVMNSGKAVETAIVGREGALCAMAGMGIYFSSVRVRVELAMIALRLPAHIFRKLTGASRALINLCVQYNDVLLTQTRIIAACNSLHPIEARFARWLLSVSDVSGTDAMKLTQETIAEMLGVRRSSVSEVANKLALAGVVRYSRGALVIHSRTQLAQLSCECYSTLRLARRAE